MKAVDESVLWMRVLSACQICYFPKADRKIIVLVPRLIQFNCKQNFKRKE